MKPETLGLIAAVLLLAFAARSLIATEEAAQKQVEEVGHQIECIGRNALKKEEIVR